MIRDSGMGNEDEHDGAGDGSSADAEQPQVTPKAAPAVPVVPVFSPPPGTEGESVPVAAPVAAPAVKPVPKALPIDEALTEFFDRDVVQPLEPPAPSQPDRPRQDTEDLIADVAQDLIAFGEAREAEKAAKEGDGPPKAIPVGEVPKARVIAVATPAKQAIPASWIAAGGAAVGLLVLLVWGFAATDDSGKPGPQAASTARVDAVASPAQPSDGTTQDHEQATASTSAQSASDDSNTDDDATRAKSSKDERASKKPAAKTRSRKKDEGSASTSDDPEAAVIAACRRKDRAAAKAALKKVALFQRRNVKKRCKAMGVDL